MQRMRRGYEPSRQLSLPDKKTPGQERHPGPGFNSEYELQSKLHQTFR